MELEAARQRAFEELTYCSLDLSDNTEKRRTRAENALLQFLVDIGEIDVARYYRVTVG